MEDAAALEAEDEDDPSNLQLSWEMLELAKMVLLDQLEGEASKTLSEENKTMIEKRLFETFLTLGEVSLENENYPQAVEDLTLCLNKQQVYFHLSSQTDHYNAGDYLFRKSSLTTPGTLRSLSTSWASLWDSI